MIFSFASWVIYLPIGCRHPFIRYWLPLLGKSTATRSLWHPENEHQQSINSFSCCIFGNQGIALSSAFRTELLTAVIDKNTMYQWQNTNSKLIDIASCKACKIISFVVENAILIRYYSHTPKASALIESMDGPAAQPADNPRNSEALGVYHRAVPELMDRVYWQPGPPFWQRFGLDPDPDLKWRSGTVANTTGAVSDFPTTIYSNESGFRHTTVAQTHSISLTRSMTRFLTDWPSKASGTRKLAPVHPAS